MEKFQLSKHFHFPWPVNVSLCALLHVFMGAHTPIPECVGVGVGVNQEGFSNYGATSACH